MTTEKFFANFGHLADSPNGVQKLRELILQLAVQGKLVAQNADDEPASVLLARIDAEKERLIDDGTIKKPKPLSPVTDAEVAFDLPSSWVWTRLGHVTTYGVTDKSELNEVSGETWVLELEDVEKVTSRLRQRVRCKDRQFRSSKNRFQQGDVIYGKLRPYLDKVIVADEDGVCTTEMLPIRGYLGVSPEYLRWALKTPNFIEYANSATHGMNLPRLGTDKGRLAPFPLPPLEEQKRIVAKVDQLMILCDELEARQQRQQQGRVRLNNAALKAFLTAREPGEFADHWQRICNNFDLLYNHPETIGELRATILQLAVQGKLVPQDPSDEPASVLLARIKVKKERLVKEGKLKKKKPPSEIDDIEKPFKLPNGTSWARLQDLVLLLGDGLHGTPIYTPGTRYYFVNGNNLNNGLIEIKSHTRTVSYEELQKHKKELSSNSVLVSINGTLGKVAFYNNEEIVLA